MHDLTSPSTASNTTEVAAEDANAETTLGVSHLCIDGAAALAAIDDDVKRIAMVAASEAPSRTRVTWPVARYGLD